MLMFFEEESLASTDEVDNPVLDTTPTAPDVESAPHVTAEGEEESTTGGETVEERLERLQQELAKEQALRQEGNRQRAQSVIEAQRLAREVAQLRQVPQAPQQQVPLDDQTQQALSIVKQAVRQARAEEQYEERLTVAQQVDAEMEVALNEYYATAAPEEAHITWNLVNKLREVDPVTLQPRWLDPATGGYISDPNEAIAKLSGAYKKREDKAAQRDLAKVQRQQAAAPTTSGAAPALDDELPALTAEEILVADRNRIPHNVFAQIKKEKAQGG